MTIRISSPGEIDLSTVKDQITDKAREIGFDACSFTTASLPETKEAQLRAALAKGHHGTMAWMETRITERAHPQGLWPVAQSVIMLGVNYGPDHNPLEKLQLRSKGNISVYAQNEDYHDLIKKRLKQLGRWMCEAFGCEIKVFVDTAPVMEKPLAAQAGLGWQGKHTNLVSREYGSWLFLGSIYTTLPLPPDKSEIDHCGSCRACLDICPTHAFPSPYRLDARKCISYLTIEHKDHIAEEYRKPMGNRIYGCDDCLAVCPWNKFADEAREAKLIAREELRAPSLAELSILDDTAFRQLFRKSPVKRIGRDRFVRNVMIAMGNSQDVDLLPHIDVKLDDPSPLVRAMAVWAWGQLRGDDKRLKERLGIEDDQDVQSEIKNALKRYTSRAGLTPS